MKLRVLFILDGLQVDPIIVKQQVGLGDITAIELRNIYRNRETDWAKDSVRFYKNYQVDKAPWVENSEWDKYSLHRVKKMTKELEEGIALLSKYLVSNVSASASSSSSSASSINHGDQWTAAEAAKFVEEVSIYKRIDENNAGIYEEAVETMLLDLRGIQKKYGISTRSSEKDLLFQFRDI